MKLSKSSREISEIFFTSTIRVQVLTMDKKGDFFVHIRSYLGTFNLLKCILKRFYKLWDVLLSKVLKNNARSIPPPPTQTPIEV